MYHEGDASAQVSYLTFLGVLSKSQNLIVILRICINWIKFNELADIFNENIW